MKNRSASKKNYTYISIIVLLLVIIGVMMLSENNTKEISNNNNSNKNYTPVTHNNAKKNNSVDKTIEALTHESTVVSFVKENGRLPDYYITKKKARQQGWNAAQGNLCDRLPGKAIGGDIFTNRDEQLPIKSNRTWYEADLNYNCGHRNAHRLLFSNDGLVFVTNDHYKTFIKK